TPGYPPAPAQNFTLSRPVPNTSRELVSPHEAITILRSPSVRTAGRVAGLAGTGMGYEPSSLVRERTSHLAVLRSSSGGAIEYSSAFERNSRHAATGSPSPAPRRANWVEPATPQTKAPSAAPNSTSVISINPRHAKT